MIYDSQKCLKWIKDNYDIDFHDRFGIVDLVFEYIKRHEEDRFKEIEAELKRKEELKEKEKTRTDYEEITDENGRVWYNRAHYSAQREESRKLRRGDAIRFKANLPGYTGTEDGIMIIQSFDFESDFAARAYYQVSDWKEKDKNTGVETVTTNHINIGSSPGTYSFSYATTEEIQSFFDTIKKIDPRKFKIYFIDEDIVPEYIKDRYHMYIN